MTGDGGAQDATTQPPVRPGSTLSIPDLLRGAVRDSDGKPFTPQAKYSYAGERGLKTPKLALAAAREFAAQGVPMEEIRQTTGWFRAKDDKWRFELSDKDAKLKDGWDGYGNTIGEAIDHPALFENYPSLADIDLVFGLNLPDNVNGGYDPKNNSIVLNPNLSKDQALSTILHELQHAVQTIEGFARGGRTDDKEFIAAAASIGIDTSDPAAMKSAYRRLMGEVEARDVQARATLTAEELRERPPYVSQGIPEEDFIIRREGAGMSMSEAAGQSAAALRASLVRKLGARAISGLERAGFSIIEREDQLPEGLRPPAGEAVRGVYHKGRSYLVAGNIPAGTELPVLLHEIGIHAGLEGLLGKKLHAEVLGRIKTAAMIGARNPNASPFVRAVMAAKARVPNDTRAAHVTEEILAYMVEETANRDLTLVKRVLAAIRAWLLRHGFRIKELRPEDLVALARAAVRKVSREATVQRVPTERTAGAYSVEGNQRLRSVREAMAEIAAGKAESVARGLRPDLSRYGGDADVRFKWGDAKHGIAHIATERGADVLGSVLRTVALGGQVQYVPAKKTVRITHEGTVAILSLDEHGQRKTWLLTGWEEGKPDARAEVSTRSAATQPGPTFSRTELGADFLDTITAEKGPVKGAGGRLSAETGPLWFSEMAKVHRRQGAGKGAARAVEGIAYWLGEGRQVQRRGTRVERIARIPGLAAGTGDKGPGAWVRARERCADRGDGACRSIRDASNR